MRKRFVGCLCLGQQRGSPSQNGRDRSHPTRMWTPSPHVPVVWGRESRWGGKEEVGKLLETLVFGGGVGFCKKQAVKLRISLPPDSA